MNFNLLLILSSLILPLRTAASTLGLFQLNNGHFSSTASKPSPCMCICCGQRVESVDHFRATQCELCSVELACSPSTLWAAWQATDRCQLSLGVDYNADMPVKMWLADEAMSCSPTIWLENMFIWLSLSIDQFLTHALSLSRCLSLRLSLSPSLSLSLRLSLSPPPPPPFFFHSVCHSEHVL